MQLLFGICLVFFAFQINCLVLNLKSAIRPELSLHAITGGRPPSTGSKRGAIYPGAPVPIPVSSEKKDERNNANKKRYSKPAGSSPRRKENVLVGGVNNNDDDNEDEDSEMDINGSVVGKEIKLSDEERLQKVLARAGISSRRGAEALILDGRVVVNGKPVTEVGTKVNAKKDMILVDGKKISLPDSKGTFWVMVNKPRAVLTTMDDDKKDKERRTLVDLVPKAKELRLVPVGAMERDSTGLMLLTNDVGWIHPLTHHSYIQSRRYEVVVSAFPEESSLEVLRKGGGILPPDKIAVGARGAAIHDTAPLKPCTVNIIDVDNTGGLVLIDLLIEESRPQQVQRMMELIGCPVVSIKRTGFGSVKLAGLRRGQWKEISASEVEKLKASCRRAVPLVESEVGKGETLGGILKRRRARPQSKPGSGYAARTAHLEAQGTRVDGPRGDRRKSGPGAGPSAPRVFGSKRPSRAKPSQ